MQLNGGGIVNENQRLILVCHTDAYPSIDSYQWYRNNQPLNVGATTSSMIVEKVSKYDDGIYTCVVKNTVKYSNGTSIERINQTQTTVTVQCTIRSPQLSFSLFSIFRWAESDDDDIDDRHGYLHQRDFTLVRDRFFSRVEDLLEISQSSHRSIDEIFHCAEHIQLAVDYQADLFER